VLSRIKTSLRPIVVSVAPRNTAVKADVLLPHVPRIAPCTFGAAVFSVVMAGIDNNNHHHNHFVERHARRYRGVRINPSGPVETVMPLNGLNGTASCSAVRYGTMKGKARTRLIEITSLGATISLL